MQNHTTCLIAECPTSPVGRGWCNKHYRRWKKYGDPLGAAPPRVPKPVRTCLIPNCPEKHLARDRCKKHYQDLYYLTNRSTFLEKAAAYRSTRRKQCAEVARKWRKRNPERAREAVRRYQRTHKAELREKRRDYCRLNRDLVRALNNRRWAWKKNAPINDLTAQQWRDIKAAYRQRCAYCHRLRPLTMDHVIPLSRGGPHTASNIVPACRSCNSSKGAREAPEHQPLLF